jgi:hypothetical protein
MGTKITFFVEAPTEWVPSDQRGNWLNNLFLSRRNGLPPLAESLKNADVALSIAASTLDAPTASALREIISIGVPVTLWAVLPDTDGYFYGLKNLEKAIARTNDILAWATENNLRYNRIGFDLEAPVQVLAALNSGKLPTAAMAILQTMLLKGRKVLQSRFVQYVQGIRSAEFYVFPKMLHSLLGGGLTPPEGLGVRTIVMAYSSMILNPLFGFKAMMAGNDKKVIPAIGLLNGIEGETPGRDFGGGMPKHLTVAHLANLLRCIEEKEYFEAYIFAMNSRLCWEQYQSAVAMV